MREILFRGKTNDGQWLEGDLIQYADTSQIWVQTDEGKWNFIVDPATVGQFTGLVDKNGKKIFEGDIFVSDYFEDGTKFVVVFEHGAFCGKSERTGIFPLGFANDSDETGCEDDDLYYPDDYSTHIKVVGNIHDNPELLEAKS